MKIHPVGWFANLAPQLKKIIANAIILLILFTLYGFLLYKKLNNGMDESFQYIIDLVALFIGIICYCVDTSLLLEKSRYWMSILRSITFMSVFAPLSLHLIPELGEGLENLAGVQFTSATIAITMVFMVIVLLFITKFLAVREVNKEVKAMSIMDRIKRVSLFNKKCRKLEQARLSDIDYIMTQIVYETDRGSFNFSNGNDFSEISKDLKGIANAHENNEKINYVLFVLKEKNKRVGFALVGANDASKNLDKHVELRLFSIDNSKRGKGLGKEFLNLLIEGLKGMPIVAKCLNSNSIMPKLLKDKGFVKDEAISSKNTDIYILNR